MKDYCPDCEKTVAIQTHNFDKDIYMCADCGQVTQEQGFQGLNIELGLGTRVVADIESMSDDECWTGICFVEVEKDAYPGMPIDFGCKVTDVEIGADVRFISKDVRSFDAIIAACERAKSRLKVKMGITAVPGMSVTNTPFMGTTALEILMADTPSCPVCNCDLKNGICVICGYTGEKS